MPTNSSASTVANRPTRLVMAFSVSAAVVTRTTVRGQPWGQAHGRKHGQDHHGHHIAVSALEALCQVPAGTKVEIAHPDQAVERSAAGGSARSGEQGDSSEARCRLGGGISL